jgi:hypothetical protein
MNIGELFVTLGVNTETMKVKEFTRAIGELPVQVLGAIAALAGIEFEMSKLAGEAMNAAVGFEAFGSQTGLSWRELQRWQIVAVQANVSAEAVTSSVSNLQRQLAEIRLGRGNISPFAMLGIDPRQNAFGVLQQLRKRLPGMDRAMASNLMGQMGLSPEMLQVLSLSDRKFAEFGRTVTGITGEQEKSFLKAKLALNQLGLEFKDFSFQHLAPLLEGFADLMGSLQEMQGALPLLATGALALGAAFAPVTTAVIALLAVLEDLVGYEQGKDSLIGTILGGKKSKGEMGFVESIKTIRDALINDPASIGDAAAQGIINMFHRPSSANVGGGSNTNVSIHVHGSDDPHATAAAVDEHLRRTLSHTGTQLNGKQDQK